MAADFKFTVEPIRSFVRIDMAGLFVAADIERFIAAQDVAYRQLRCAPNQHVTMVDMCKMEIQPQMSVAAFQQRLGDPKVAARRIAFIVSKSLARMQIKRATDGLTTSFFSSETEALQWLYGA